MGRLGSGIWVNANVLDGEGNCLGGGMRSMSSTHIFISTLWCSSLHVTHDIYSAVFTATTCGMLVAVCSPDRSRG